MVTVFYGRQVPRMVKTRKYACKRPNRIASSNTSEMDKSEEQFSDTPPTTQSSSSIQNQHQDPFDIDNITGNVTVNRTNARRTRSISKLLKNNGNSVEAV